MIQKTRIKIRIKLLLISLFFAFGAHSDGLIVSQGFAYEDEINVLFLGDSGHHQPKQRFDQLLPVMEARGIKLTYTDRLIDLNADNLAQYDALLLYANIDRIEAPQEKAILDYVASGGGFVPIHCATYCFQNSDQLVALMGAQFQRHGTGLFRTVIADSSHPIMKGFGGFESWDETYVHHRHNNQDRTVLAYRVDKDGREPWTWVRTHGQGRVFYTAWGHDQRTWGNAGFQNLMERGIRWATKDDLTEVPDYLVDRPFPVPEMTPQRKDVMPFEFIEAGGEIPNYTPGKAWGVMGKAFSKMQKPLEPEESIKHFVVPQGFRVELFASEPEIGGKPICMAWDHRGRLWIAETYDYPNQLQPDGKGRDRIRILEDTDGDWKADKFTVFAEKLSIPTSLTFFRGGVIVHDGKRTLYMKDTDGDDVADERVELFTGWQLGDTHGGVSNFQYGLDNWIWAMQGYNRSQPRSAQVSGQQFHQGFFRFRPDGSDLEFLRSTNNNTWGLGFSEEGIVFGSTANRNPSVYMPIPNRYYERVRGWTTSLTLGSIADTHLFEPITGKVRQVDHHGGYTAGAGHALYTARRYPREYWNRVAFVNGPTGHLVGSFILSSNGSDFRAESPFNLLASDDEWCAPIMAEVGPDGNVWVIDWYNYIVQHNPTPQGFNTGRGNAYETKLRDKKHGRIYRVVYGSDTTPPMTLLNATEEKLVNTLRHPNMLWRKHAQRLLVERGRADVVNQLIAMVKTADVDPIGLDVGAIHALWTLHGLGQLDGSNTAANTVAFAALSHRSAGVRRNALQTLPPISDATRALVASKVLYDSDAQVRLAARLALADLPPSADAGRSLADVAQQDAGSDDRWMNEATISAAAMNDVSFLMSIAERERIADPISDSISIVAEHFARGAKDKPVTDIVSALARGNPDVAKAAMSGFAKGWPIENSPALTPELESSLAKLMENLPNGSRGLLVKLAIGWGSKKFDKYAQDVKTELLNRLDRETLDVQQRVAAARELVEFQSSEAATVTELLKRITPQLSPEMSLGILDALRQSESASTGNMIGQRMAGMSPTSRTTAISVLLGRNESTGSLLDLIDDGSVLLSELTLDQKQSLSNHRDDTIQQRARTLLRRGGALPSEDRQQVLAEWFVATTTIGDAVSGKAIFKEQCGKCHTHSGEGVEIGPDLTGMAVHPKSELLTHILDPNRDVEGNFRLYKVLTLEGRLINGLLASESKTSVELYDTEGKRHVVLREDIDQLQVSALSAMPEGFENQIDVHQMADLLEFLTERGKFVPLDLRKVATITSVKGMFLDKSGPAERLIFSNWEPKTFQGVPFRLIDPQNGSVENAIELYGPLGKVSREMPRSVEIPCNGPVKAIHLLSGVSGWGFPYSRKETVSMIVRFTYDDHSSEDHELINGQHFADYIRRVDVPKSEFAFALRGQQLRFLTIYPKRNDPVQRIEFVKGKDQTAPVVMAVTLETEQAEDHQ